MTTRVKDSSSVSWLSQGGIRQILARHRAETIREEQRLEDQEVVRQAREEFDQQVQRYLTRWDKRDSSIVSSPPRSPLGAK